jgi:hypothetical protein
LESDEFDLRKRVESFRNDNVGQLHRGKFEKSLVEIHSEKFEYELFYQLDHAGLAKQLTNGWYSVERKTANELMTFIATVLVIRLNYLPTTDRFKLKSFRAVGLKKKELRGFEKQNSKRELVLENLIPFPRQFDLKKLNKFKSNNLRLLKQFKNRVEEIVLDSSIDPKSDLFEQKIEVLKDQKTEISARMNESRLVPKFISVAGIITAIEGLQSENEVGQIAGAIGLVGAIAQALAIEKPRNTVDQTGLKYLALAERTLIRPTPYFSI